MMFLERRKENRLRFDDQAKREIGIDQRERVSATPDCALRDNARLELQLAFDRGGRRNPSRNTLGNVPAMYCRSTGDPVGENISAASDGMANAVAQHGAS